MLQKGEVQVKHLVILPHLRVAHDQLAAFCRRHHIRKLSFFGSVLRQDFGPDSDIDVLVEFEPSAPVGYFALVDAQRDLSALVGGRQIDLVTANALHPAIREQVLAKAKVAYVQH